MPYVPSKKTPGQMEKFNEDDREVLDPLAKQLADAIAKVASKYKYQGAFLGELNYSITRLIQHLPRALVKTGESPAEIKYCLQAGIMGVCLDVALEYKRRVNHAYETAQIIKSGDCYDTPYYTRVVEVVDDKDKHVGHMEVHLKRDESTLNIDILPKKVRLVK